MITDEEPASPIAGEPTPRRSGSPLFIATIAVSSFTLFALELLAGRLALPILGGTPSVWTTALCFFTGVVFIGYVYSHFVATRLGPRAGGAVHLAVAAGAVAATLLAPNDVSSLRYPAMPAALNVLLVLVVVAGAPSLLLATTTPLLSSWFSGRGRDPWWLYAVSNAASLAGLLAYPLLIEPSMPLSAQRTALDVLLVAVAALLAGVAAGGFRARMEVPRAIAAPVVPRPALRQRAAWLFAAAVPAGLLAATTTHLATDHLSAPLLWIGPLGIYLASFVVAFSVSGRRVLPIAEKLVPAAVTLMWVPFVARLSFPVLVLVPVMLGSFAVLAVAIHGRLAQSRPGGAYVTDFYVMVSAGGLIATVFVALVAPVLFSDVYEFPILLVSGLVALALLPGQPWTPAGNPRAAIKASGIRLLPYVAACALLIATAPAEPRGSAIFLSMVLLIGMLAIAMGRSPRSLAVGSTAALVVLLLLFSPPYLVRIRTFFGITEVRSDREGAARFEIHGTTLHGLQFTDERRLEPTSYFVRTGPLGDVFENLQARAPGGGDIGVVGLGIGTIAVYARPEDSLSYFEVDQAVVDLARDPRYFSYLADARTRPRVVLGDGRLSLAAEPARSLDLLVLDAFSSDSVPAHLLTREAMQSYVRTLRPGGIIAFQLTNRHFELVPAVASTARSVGLDARRLDYTPGEPEREELAALPSRWLVIGHPADVMWFDAQGWTSPESGPVLSDDYSDMVRLLRWR